MPSSCCGKGTRRDTSSLTSFCQTSTCQVGRPLRVPASRDLCRGSRCSCIRFVWHMALGVHGAAAGQRLPAVAWAGDGPCRLWCWQLAGRCSREAPGAQRHEAARSVKAAAAAAATQEVLGWQRQRRKPLACSSSSTQPGRVFWAPGPPARAACLLGCAHQARQACCPWLWVLPLVADADQGAVCRHGRLQAAGAHWAGTRPACHQ